MTIENSWAPKGTEENVQLIKVIKAAGRTWVWSVVEGSSLLVAVTGGARI